MNKKLLRMCKVEYSERKYDQVIIIFDNHRTTRRKIYKNKKRKLFYVTWDKRYFLLLSYDENQNSYKYLEVTKDYIEGKKLKDELETVFLSDVDVEEEKPKEELYKTKISHPKEEQIMRCVKCNIPVFLVGPAGTGKNYTLQKIAENLGLDFYFTNSVQQEYKITGFIDAGGIYHETEFYKAFLNGGLFFIDELDASIPDVLILLNAAIENRYFEFPNGRITAHKKFRVVAAGNTFGNGADEFYTGRSVIDASTLDRFISITFDYERDIEMSISKGNKDLVNFVRELRRISKQNGIRAIFSYRAILNVTKLEKVGMDLEEILEISIFKGMNRDTINTFSLWNDNTKYGKALKNIQDRV